MIRVALAAGFALAATATVAQEPGPSWREVKCERYRAVSAEALARTGRQGLTDEFLARHDAFLRSGCTAKADVCPRSARDFALADILTIGAMNAGTASTFLPFACPPPAGAHPTS
ncbi:MAG: hypothetical protein JO048_09580 [Methylobacteriaceae bacterium]|nr:hypothetical protein [Methylobacteriaceae bacterium]